MLPNNNPPPVPPPPLIAHASETDLTTVDTTVDAPLAMCSESNGGKWHHDYRKDNYLFPNKPDWTVQSMNGTHIWLETEVSGCCASFSTGSQDCKKSGARRKCSACKLVAHEKCIQQDVDNIPKCRMTFREASLKSSFEVNPEHHISYRRRQDGRCDVCGKSFPSMLSYKTQKDKIALNCTWCKRAFHSKDCANQFLLDKQCDLGIHKNVILPPSWIVMLPSRKYSTVAGKRGRHQQPSTRRQSSRERRAFVIKPIEGDNEKVPLIVFVNPRSGGNQGYRILQKCQYILNPRQVFDLTQGGPRFGLDLYRKVPNLRVLVCGGDGSVGWVLSEIDHLKMNHPPSVSILPLGTGNDLARFLGWGGGYADEPLSKIMTHVEEGEVQRLDRWDLDVKPHCPNQGVEGGSSTSAPEQSTDEKGQSKLPLNVMNNYFSMGADADVVLQFHESRESNPEKFNSRVRNKYFYARLGGESIVKRKNVDLYKCIESFRCDGIDITSRIRELKPTSIVFLNIPYYASGTSPWGNPSNEAFLPQSCDDGYLEIVGLTSAHLAFSHVGAHGIRIFQCQSALLHTTTKIAMQVDGEPCRLNPSRILVKRRNQANMVVKKKPQNILYHQKTLEFESQELQPSVPLYIMKFSDYSNLVNYDLVEINSVVSEITTIQVDTDMQLDDMRKRIDCMNQTGQLTPQLSDEWCFLDAKWRSRIYRIDDATESLMHISDIAEEGIYLLDLHRSSGTSSSELNLPLNINHSTSQPNSPNRERRGSPLPIVKENTTCRLTKSLDNSFLPMVFREVDNEEDADEDVIVSGSETDSELSDFSEDGSSSSSPGILSPPLIPQVTLTTHSCSTSPSTHMGISPCSSMDNNEKGMLEAAKRGFLKQVQDFFESGTSLTVCDRSGRTPLHIAARYGHKEIVSFLVDNLSTTDINGTDTVNQQTPLHLAAMHKRRTICRTLIGRGALVTCFDKDGLSPRLLALNSHDRDLAKYLQSQERLQLIAADDHETAV